MALGLEIKKAKDESRMGEFFCFVKFWFVKPIMLLPPTQNHQRKILYPTRCLRYRALLQAYPNGRLATQSPLGKLRITHPFQHLRHRVINARQFIPARFAFFGLHHIGPMKELITACGRVHLHLKRPLPGKLRHLAKAGGRASVALKKADLHLTARSHRTNHNRVRRWPD